MGDVPLSGLLARAISDLTMEFRAEGAGDGGLPSPAMWFGFLRAMPPSGVVGPRELQVRTRLSKRAVRQLIGAATRAGWIEVASGTGAHATLGLTEAGRKVGSTWTAMIDPVEDRWGKRVGADTVELRSRLGHLVHKFPLELPHYPISYGSADVSVTGGRFRPGSAGPPRIPAHGQDWAPVVRDDADTVSSLPLIALLSQAFVAFMIDYSESRGGALVTAEGLARGFGARTKVALTDLPPSLRVRGDGKSGLERYRIVTVAADRTDARVKVVRLTGAGQRMRDAYGVLVDRIEKEWRAAFGSETVDHVRRHLEAALPSLDASLPDAFIENYVLT